MKYHIQTDDRWEKDVMTFCHVPNWEGKTWIDYFWRYGCLATAFSNIIQFFTSQNFNPGLFNELMIDIKGYNYLQNSNCEEAKASYIHWDNVKRYFRNSFDINLHLSSNDYKENFKIKYIAKVLHRDTNKGHYINIFEKYKNIFWCFDTEFGDVISFKTDQILKIHEFEYLGGIDGII